MRGFEQQSDALFVYLSPEAFVPKEPSASADSADGRYGIGESFGGIQPNLLPYRPAVDST
jgi:hypothetical protein